jgi:hypothetical protein
VVLKRITPRVVMLASLGIMWLNYAFTARWADIPGSIHGPKQPVFLVLLGLTTILALAPWPRARQPLGLWARAIGWCGFVTLAALFFIWFPPRTWQEIPFLDNWPARYQSTIDGIDLLWRGAFTGWQWQYLGGYQLSSDVTQSHTVLAFIPVLLTGPQVGFHLLLLVMFLAPPALVFWDLASDDEETRYVAAGLTAIVTAGFSYLLLRSGDTNSLAGVGCTMLALVASRLAAGGNAWGGPLLLMALVLLNYVHAGFLVYAALFLALESLFYKDLSRLLRAAFATGAAVVAGLPLHWESWRYSAYFIPNNVVFDPDAPFSLVPFLRKVYYNVELLALPGRWFNDFTGLSGVLLPMTAYVAWRVRSRAGFYAWIAIATIALLRLNTPEFAYLFLRPVHVLAVCVGPVIAVFLSRFVNRRALAISSVALIAAYLQVLVFQVPHIPTMRDSDPELADHIAGLDGALVLFESTPHRDMDADPTRTTAPPPVAAHVEQALGPATGRRLYAGLWDGLQWSPYRSQILAGGAFKGEAIDRVPIETFTAELRKWGIRHLVVWSDASLKRLKERPEIFVERWRSGLWHEFEYVDADPREIAADIGSGRLVSFEPLGGRAELDGVRAGTRVVVRTNYHPSWSAHVDGSSEPLPLFDAGGQLGFVAPKDGQYSVVLTYPRRVWLAVLAALTVGLATMVLTRWPRKAPSVAPVERHLGAIRAESRQAIVRETDAEGERAPGRSSNVNV